MIKAVVFDLDDTLYPEHQYVLSGFKAVSAWVSANHSVHGFYEVAVMLFHNGDRGKIFNQTLERLGLPCTAKLIGQLVKLYRGHTPDLSLYEDAAWAISHFGKNFKLGMITDGFLVAQRNKVAALGIAAKFDSICYSDQYGRECWKPSPVPYQRVMESLDCKGKECVYVADNPIKDFITARSLGWKTVQICRHAGEYAHIVPKDSYQADLKITTLYELERIIPFNKK